MFNGALSSLLCHSLCANHWSLMKNIQVVFYRPPTVHKHTNTSKHHQSHTYTYMYTVSAMNALHFSPNHSYIETVAHTYTFTNAQPSPAAISNEILKAFSVFLCHILNSAAVVAHHTTHTHTHRLCLITIDDTDLHRCRHTATLSIQLPSYYSRASRMHTQTGPVRTQACMRTHISFALQPKSYTNPTTGVSMTISIIFSCNPLML